MIGKVGQIPRLFLTGVPYVQEIRRLRRSGDANVICRHLRHTCTSTCHFHMLWKISSLSRQKSNISSKTSSGSTLIVVVWRQALPMPHKLSTRLSGHGKQEEV